MPYVRKSFWKHYKDGMKYILHLDDAGCSKMLSGVADAYKKSHEKDFSFLDAEIIDACYNSPANANSVVQYAHDMT